MLSELQAISGGECVDGSTPERTLSRLESAAMVFAGELRTIHDLLYRPQLQPDEPVIEGLLANLAADLDELRALLERAPDARHRSALLDSTVSAISSRAAEICGECVPHEYAPELKVWMNRIQELARSLSARA